MQHQMKGLQRGLASSGAITIFPAVVLANAMSLVRHT